MKLTQQDMARLLEIDARTLRNWRNDKPYLYKIIMQGFAVEDVKNVLLEHYQKIDEVVKSHDTSHKK